MEYQIKTLFRSNFKCMLFSYYFGFPLWQHVKEQVKLSQSLCIWAIHILVMRSEVKLVGASRETIKRSIYIVVAVSCQCMLQDNVYSLASGKITLGWKQTRLLKKGSVPPSSQSCGGFDSGQLQMRLWERDESHEGDGIVGTQGARRPDSSLEAAAVPGGKPLPHHGREHVHHESSPNLTERFHKSLLSLCKPWGFFCPILADTKLMNWASSGQIWWKCSPKHSLALWMENSKYLLYNKETVESMEKILTFMVEWIHMKCII